MTKPKGTQIICGQDAVSYKKTIDYVSSFLEERGFNYVNIPSIWPTETFVKKSGPEILNQMYTFKDKGDRDLCLIPEVTGIIQELWNEGWSKQFPKPYKIFYVQKCYRYEQPQAGRYREFTQLGIEILGDDKEKEKYNQYSKEILIELLESGYFSSNLAFEFKDSVKRGLSYYTEFGFEVECPKLGAQKQIAGGGRYAEGIGWAIGIDRLLLAMKNG